MLIREGGGGGIPPQGHHNTEVNKATSQCFATLFWLSIQVRIPWSEGRHRGGGLWRSSLGLKGTGEGGRMDVMWWRFSHNKREGWLNPKLLNSVSFSDLVWDQKNMQMIQNDLSIGWGEIRLLKKLGQCERAGSYLTQNGLSGYISSWICGLEGKLTVETEH